VVAGPRRSAGGASATDRRARKRWSLSLGTPRSEVSRAFASFEQGDFAAAIDALEPIAEELERIGGSRAQLDLVEFTLFRAPRTAWTMRAGCWACDVAVPRAFPLPGWRRSADALRLLSPDRGPTAFIALAREGESLSLHSAMIADHIVLPVESQSNLPTQVGRQAPEYGRCAGDVLDPRGGGRCNGAVAPRHLRAGASLP
jgi:hypothetical protein